MDRLDVGATPITRAAIETEEQARAWVCHLVDEMTLWRLACDAPVPGNSRDVRAQQRALWTFLTKQGQVIGALKSLRMTGFISDVCFDELNQKALNTLIPSVVGSVDS